MSSLPLESGIRGDEWRYVRCESSHPNTEVYKTNELLLIDRQSGSIMLTVTYTGSQFTHNSHLRTTTPLTK